MNNTIRFTDASDFHTPHLFAALQQHGMEHQTTKIFHLFTQERSQEITETLANWVARHHA